LQPPGFVGTFPPLPTWALINVLSRRASDLHRLEKLVELKFFIGKTFL